MGESRTKKIPGWVKWVVKLLVSGGLLTWFFATGDIDWSDLWALFSQLDILYLAIAAALLLALLAMGGWRWKILLRAVGMEVPVWMCVRLTMASMFFSIISIGPIAADGLRTWWMTRIHSGRVTSIIMTLFVDRICGLTALGIICLGLFPTQWEVLMSRPSTASILVIVLLVLGGSLGMVIMLFLIGRYTGSNAPQWIQKLPLSKQRGDMVSAIEAYQSRPLAIVQAVGISLVIQVMAVFVGLFTLWSLRLDFPFLYGAIIAPVVNVMQALPITVMGLGIREASVAELFSHFKDAREPALAFSMLTLALNLLGAFVGLIAWLTLGLKSRDALPPHEQQPEN